LSPFGGPDAPIERNVWRARVELLFRTRASVPVADKLGAHAGAQRLGKKFAPVVEGLEVNSLQTAITSPLPEPELLFWRFPPLHITRSILKAEREEMSITILEGLNPTPIRAGAATGGEARGYAVEVKLTCEGLVVLENDEPETAPPLVAVRVMFWPEVPTVMPVPVIPTVPERPWIVATPPLDVPPVLT
jgi:hypothetical protein